MKSHAAKDLSSEIELKLALPASNTSDLAQRLARTAPLARRKAVRTRLYNVYYDTPTQSLRRQGVALRIRRKADAAKPQWLQTLKTANTGGSALSCRGEWESQVSGSALDLNALLADGPWSRIDPDGSLFRTLVPCFSTDFERTIWLAPRRDGSVVEVALDVGEIIAGERRAPICELELELKAGQPLTLFDAARQIADTIVVLPLVSAPIEI